MELIYTGKFRRDLRKLTGRALFHALKENFKNIKNAPDTTHIPFFKKLKRYDRIYRLEIRLKKGKIYWIVCSVIGNKIYLRRIKSEAYIKRQLKSYHP